MKRQADEKERAILRSMFDLLREQPADDVERLKALADEASQAGYYETATFILLNARVLAAAPREKV